MMTIVVVVLMMAMVVVADHRTQLTLAVYL